MINSWEEDVIYEMQANFGPRDMFLRKIIILIGMGGLGKTQIALEYAYRFNKEYSAILFLRASTDISSLLRETAQSVPRFKATFLTYPSSIQTWQL
jgi:2-phosphoglycerate kinase